MWSALGTWVSAPGKWVSALAARLELGLAQLAQVPVLARGLFVGASNWHCAGGPQLA